MAADPSRRSPRLLAVIATFALLPLLAACGDDDDGDDDDDNDGMRAMPRVASVLVIAE
ncbi:hypothetical protein ACTG9Q_25875 [Actinokineospora sp. 24-640]